MKTAAQTEMEPIESPRNWLITGGCGFIGSALATRLIEDGRRLRILDNLSVGSAAALPGESWERLEAGSAVDSWTGRQLVVADLGDASALRAAARGADVVVHLAANTGVHQSVEAPGADCEVNVIGTLNCLEAARATGVGRFVFASSGAPLGNCEPPLHEDKAPRPLSPYGASKLAGEGYCSAYYGSFGLETAALRFGNVYGPGSDHKQSVVAKFIRRALEGEPLEIYGDGTQTRDFIYIDDIVEALCRAAATPGIGGDLFQIASSRERTVNEVANAIARLVEPYIGRSIVIRHTEPLPFEVKRNYSDTSKARRVLGFEARTPFETGLARTLDYFVASRGKGTPIAGLASG